MSAILKESDHKIKSPSKIYNVKKFNNLELNQEHVQALNKIQSNLHSRMQMMREEMNTREKKQQENFMRSK